MFIYTGISWRFPLASVTSLLSDDVTTLCSAAEGLSKASDKLSKSATD